MASLTDNKYNLTMWQGSTFGLNIVIRDSSDVVQDLTGCSVRMQIRPSYDSTEITETLTSANGEITITPTTGNIHLQLDAERTANISVDLTNGKPPRTVYVYDLELVDQSDNVSKILYGDIRVYGEVTR